MQNDSNYLEWLSFGRTAKKDWQERCSVDNYQTNRKRQKKKFQIKSLNYSPTFTSTSNKLTPQPSMSHLNDIIASFAQYKQLLTEMIKVKKNSLIDVINKRIVKETMKLFKHCAQTWLTIFWTYHATKYKSFIYRTRNSFGGSNTDQIKQITSG